MKKAKTWPELLQAALKKAGSQSNLSRHLDVTRSAVSAWVHGRSIANKHMQHLINLYLEGKFDGQSQH